MRSSQLLPTTPKGTPTRRCHQLVVLVSLFLLSLLSPSVQADILRGQVTKVVDGDTLYVLDADQSRYKIRLAGIDTPERAQPFGAKAKQYLLELVGGKPVEIVWSKRDRYGRIIGKVIYNDTDINLAMVRAGLAWWYRKYANEQSPADRVLYEAAEDEARTERRGLWRDPNPMPSWRWRRR
jgi:micrococcal nuclease